MRIIQVFSITLFLSLVALACQKDITIKPVSSYEGQLFIEGILYPGEPPTIYLSQSFPFFNQKVTPQETFARGAEVQIKHGAQMELLRPDSTFDKFRCRWVPFYKGVVSTQYGETYELRINYLGKAYTATTTINQPKVKIDSVQYIASFYDVYGGHDGVIVRLKDAPGAGNFYRAQIDRLIDTSKHHAHILDVIKNTCAKDEEFWVIDLGRTIFSDENVDGQKLELNVEVSFEYDKGDEATIYIQSLDAKSAAFYNDLDKQLQSILNPFVEPVFIKSTIPGAIGVFGSAVRSDAVPFVYPQDNPK